MSPYLAVLGARYRMLLQYRMAAMAGVVTQFFWGFILIMTLLVFRASSTQASPLSAQQIVTYVWLGQALFALLPWIHDRDLEAMVRRGDVAHELLRPVDLYAYWLARTLAMRIAPACSSAVH